MADDLRAYWMMGGITAEPVEMLTDSSPSARNAPTWEHW